MKPLLKATVACTLLCTSAMSFADIRKTNNEAPKTQPTQQVHDEFAHLRNSKDKMSKEEAQQVEGGAIMFAPLAAPAGAQIARSVGTQVVKYVIKENFRTNTLYRQPKQNYQNYSKHSRSH